MLCPQSSESIVSLPDTGLLASLQSDKAWSRGIHTDPAARPSGTTISLQEHPRLLALLNTEPFRAELKADPVATLAKHGIHLAPAVVPARVTLPEVTLECVVKPPHWPAWSALLV